MSRLVDDMLLLVRLDADAVPELPTLGGVNLKELISDVRDEIEALPHKKEISIEIAAPERASVRGVYGDLRRALLNLMGKRPQVHGAGRRRDGAYKGLRRRPREIRGG